MPLPDYQSFMLPLLELAADRQEHVFRDAINALADRFKLTETERKLPMPSGTKPLLDDRIGWAKTYLTKAGLLESPQARGLSNFKTRIERIALQTKDR
jgi:restriction system protein